MTTDDIPPADPWTALKGATDLLKQRGHELRIAQQRIGDQRHANQRLEAANLRFRAALQKIQRLCENPQNECMKFDALGRIAREALDKP